MKRDDKIDKRIELLTRRMAIEVVAHHIVSVNDSFTKKEPILFHLIANEEKRTYAWWPLEKQIAIDVLDTLYVTYVYEEDKQEHRTLVKQMINLLTHQLNTLKEREEARHLLELYFGTHKLGTLQRVHFHGDDRERQIGEVDFYLLPVKMASYTWLGWW